MAAAARVTLPSYSCAAEVVSGELQGKMLFASRTYAEQLSAWDPWVRQEDSSATFFRLLVWPRVSGQGGDVVCKNQIVHLSLFSDIFWGLYVLGIIYYL